MDVFILTFKLLQVYSFFQRQKLALNEINKQSYLVAEVSRNGKQ